MVEYLAYIRVSTVKQGERGTSLEEQKSAIEAYAVRHALTISAWFEEMETAAKQGRREFVRLVAELKKGCARGVIIHKIDRSARNLKDWAQLGDLMDAGVEIHFAHESLDLSSRGGRLSADIQAVVAADYIRNLRQEVIKGFYGRLKQGLYPLAAPRGYLDQGGGKPKAIDPVSGPLVRQAFELYATGDYTFWTLREEMFRRGLRKRDGAPLSQHGLATMLHNPFYIGLMRIERTGEMFEGVHAPLISKALFDRVQAVIEGRQFPRSSRHEFVFRKLIRCAACSGTLTGESRKGHVYYRCHTRTCRGTSLRERDIDDAVKAQLSRIAFDQEEMPHLERMLDDLAGTALRARQDRCAVVHRDLALCEERLARLTDAFVEGLIDKETFEIRKTTLFGQRRALRDELEAPTAEDQTSAELLKKFGRGPSAYLGYDLAFPDEKRAIVRDVISDLVARQKTIEITMRNTFQAVAEWRKLN